MFELTEIMRQRDDASFAELLNCIREGKHTEEDIRVLKTRAISAEDESYQTLNMSSIFFPAMPQLTLITQISRILQQQRKSKFNVSM